MSNPASQHVVNALPFAATVGSILADLPGVISTLVGLAALWYYYLVITKELYSRRKLKRVKLDAPSAD